MHPLLWLGLVLGAVDFGLWLTDKRRKHLRKQKQEMERQLRAYRELQ